MLTRNEENERIRQLLESDDVWINITRIEGGNSIVTAECLLTAAQYGAADSSIGVDYLLLGLSYMIYPEAIKVEKA